MTDHSIETYQDENGDHRWKIVQHYPSRKHLGLPVDEIVAQSAVGYEDKNEMFKSLFGIFFGDYDDSFLSAYNEWHPEMGQVELIPDEELADATLPSGATDSSKA